MPGDYLLKWLNGTRDNSRTGLSARIFIPLCANLVFTCLFHFLQAF